MTEQSNADLIAEARKGFRRAVRNGWAHEPERPLAILLADALEAVVRERDNWKLSAEEAERAEKRWRARAEELAAVIEKAEDYVTRHYLDTRFGDEVLPMLATAPADLLRDVKAEAWDECYETWAMLPAGDFPSESENPYRAREEQEA